MAMKLKHYSWFRVFFVFFGGEGKIYPTELQKLRGSFSKCLRDPFLAFGYVFSLPNHPAFGFLDAHVKHKPFVISQCPHQRLPGPEEPK